MHGPVSILALALVALIAAMAWVSVQIGRFLWSFFRD